ncbi:mitochondrial Protoheme IX farnesyltransferase [Coniochaeta sp. 2T2.1]|nr:mitochondrial Protoheme IX farnesyltransferase [Coniochaeta sp. 2T2.1]
MRAPRSIVRPGLLEDMCWRCRWADAPTEILQPTIRSRPFSTSKLSRTASIPISARLGPRPRKPVTFFISTSFFGRFNGTDSLASSPLGSSNPQTPSSTSSPPSPPPASAEHRNAHLPHRRRQAERRAAAAASSPSTTTSTTTTPPEEAYDPPPDASSILAQLASNQPAHSLRRRASALLSLAKPRLTVLVVLSAMASYALYPVPAFLSPAAGLADIDAPSLSPLTLLFLTTGTTLCSASANALNMLYEPKTDALMSRTRARPLVRKLVSTRAAVLFAATAAAAGIAALWTGVNPTVAGLGAANIVLYAGIYTPMKRVSWLNTWVGAIVGGIPPLMGWAAAAGESATGDGGWRELLFSFPAGWAGLWGGDDRDEATVGLTSTNTTPSSAGGWLLAGLLFAWQFPHFMALSWGVREEYKAAGLKMLSWVNPARNGRVALRYSVVFFPLCVGLCMAGVTEWSFAVTSLPVNYWLMREAVAFWRKQGQAGSARGLFWASVWHLPVIMVLALVQKKGMWGRVWRSIVGEPDDEEWEDGEWEDEP